MWYTVIDHADYWRRPAHEVAEMFGYKSGALRWFVRRQEVLTVKKDSDEMKAKIRKAKQAADEAARRAARGRR